jgi:hypothetical protein
MMTESVVTDVIKGFSGTEGLANKRLKSFLTLATEGTWPCSCESVRMNPIERHMQLFRNESLAFLIFM